MKPLRHQQCYPAAAEPAPVLPLPAVDLVRPASWRGISAKVALICVLLAFIGLLAVIGLQRIATLTQQAVVQVADVGRLRMYTKALTLEAVRPQLPDSERAKRFDAIAARVDELLATLSDDASFAIVRPLAIRASVDSLRAVWPTFRERGEQIARGATADQLFFVSEAEMLGRAEALVGALTQENERRRELLVEAIMFCLLIGFAATIFVYQLIRRTLIVPALELAAASQRLAAGELNARVPVRRRDEIGMLGRAFNESAARLNELARRQRLHEAHLRDSEERYRSLWETSTDAIIVMGDDNRIEFANAAAESVFGHSPDALLGQSIEVLQPESLRAVHREAFARHLVPDPPPLRRGTVTTQALHASGRIIDVDMAFSRFELSHGRRFAAFFRDVTERRRAEAALRLRDRAIESSSNGILICAIDSNGDGDQLEIVYVNPAFTRITGYTLEDVVGRPPVFLLDDDRDQIEIEKVCEAIRHRHATHVLLRNYRKDGALFWNELALAPVENEHGDTTHFVAICDDVTMRKRDEQALVFNATHDALTGLPNRTLLADRLEQAVGTAASHGSQLAVMSLDLDNFKMVNDGLGHAAGDELLVEVARRLTAVAGDRHTIARLGGDEFVVLIADIERAAPVAQLGTRLLEAIGQPIRVGGQDLYVGGSIGVAIFPRDGCTAEALLKNADIAMYRAKEEGKRNVQFFTDELQERVSRRLSVEGALRRAVDNGEFDLHFQPQMEIASGRLVGAEALIRWRHPERGLVSPAEFIPIAEDTGLIIPIGEWVIDAACREARRWQEGDLASDKLTMAVNLSPRQFRDGRLLKIIDDALSRHALSATTLEVELTESMVMQDPEGADRILRRMKEYGLTLALDDFGTGYSSLSYLKRFPIDILKIDQSFVRDIPHDANDSKIALAIVSLAHSLGLKVVAEGVENKAQLAFLTGAGCDMVQGYLLGRPQPGDALREFVRTHRRQERAFAD
jgi:diguanylate cyclase (GGDEF)-like protein/PAS domain S-box-containing protein